MAGVNLTPNRSRVSRVKDRVTQALSNSKRSVRLLGAGSGLDPQAQDGGSQGVMGGTGLTQLRSRAPELGIKIGAADLPTVHQVDRSSMAPGSASPEPEYDLMKVAAQQKLQTDQAGSRQHAADGLDQMVRPPALPGDAPDVPGGAPAIPDMAHPTDLYAKAIKHLTVLALQNGADDVVKAGNWARELIEQHPEWHAYREAYAEHAKKRAELTEEADPDIGVAARAYGVKTAEGQAYAEATPNYVARAGGEEKAREDQRVLGHDQNLQSDYLWKPMTAGDEQTAKEKAITDAHRTNLETDKTLKPGIAGDVKQAENAPLSQRDQNRRQNELNYAGPIAGAKEAGRGVARRMFAKDPRPGDQAWAQQAAERDTQDWMRTFPANKPPTADQLEEYKNARVTQHRLERSRIAPQQDAQPPANQFGQLQYQFAPGQQPQAGPPPQVTPAGPPMAPPPAQAQPPAAPRMSQDQVTRALTYIQAARAGHPGVDPAKAQQLATLLHSQGVPF